MELINSAQTVLSWISGESVTKLLVTLQLQMATWQMQRQTTCVHHTAHAQ